MIDGHRVRVLRGLRSQRDVARKAEITEAALRRIELGTTRNVRSSTLQRLAAALGCSTDSLLIPDHDAHASQAPQEAQVSSNGNPVGGKVAP